MFTRRDREYEARFYDLELSVVQILSFELSVPMLLDKHQWGTTILADKLHKHISRRQNRLLRRLQLDFSFKARRARLAAMLEGLPMLREENIARFTFDIPPGHRLHYVGLDILLRQHRKFDLGLGMAVLRPGGPLVIEQLNSPMAVDGWLAMSVRVDGGRTLAAQH